MKLSRRQSLHLVARAALFMAAAVTVDIHGVQASDDAKYPNWKGQWNRVVVPGVGNPLNPGWDPPAR
jgi:hypothetical protein